jgi:hypothetical protein
MNMDIFKYAVKNKMRFNYKGLCSVEDLYDIPLSDLDKMYGALKGEQKNLGVDSLLNKKTSAEKEVAIKIEIIESIVKDRLADRDKAVKAEQTRVRNRRIAEIIADKEDAALHNMSVEDLKAMLASDSTDDEEE